MVRKRVHNPDQVVISATSCPPATKSLGTVLDDYDVMTSSTLSILSEAESDLDTSGGSGRSIVAGLATTPSGNNMSQTNCYRSSPPSSYNNQYGNNTNENQAWYSHILTIEDLVEVDPSRGQFIFSLQDLVTKKQAVLATHELSTEVYLVSNTLAGSFPIEVMCKTPALLFPSTPTLLTGLHVRLMFDILLQDVRAKALSELVLELPGGQLEATKLEDLQLTFQYAHSSSIFSTADHTVVDLGKVQLQKYRNKR